MGEFLWGVASSSYQIEGDRASRAEANWDKFAERKGAIFAGHDALFASHHVARLEEDLDLLAALGVSAYRFSFSWPRLGARADDPRGVSFYERLVDGLLARGIEPVATLFHWDAPVELERLGGFLSPESPAWFASYAERVARRFGDRIRRFLTINEPHAYIEGGLRDGRHAPGHRLPLSQVLLAAHNTLKAHGLAVQVLRAHVSQSWVSAAPVLLAATPASPSPEDVEAAYRFTFSLPTDRLRVSAFWLDPLYGRGYPDEVWTRFGSLMPKVSPEDVDLISQPLDAVGVNLYDAVRVRAGAEGAAEIVPFGVGSPRTSFDWPVTPEAHYFGPKFLHQRYGLPVIITENGLSASDWIALDGRVHDADRVDFLERHLQELKRAQAEGVPILGYFHWTFLDNFEWNHGYKHRFGLVYVDFGTGARTPKDSFFAYRDRIRAERSK